MVVKKKKVYVSKEEVIESYDSEYKSSCKNIKEEFLGMRKQFEKDVKKNPVKAVAIAFGVGALVSGFIGGASHLGGCCKRKPLNKRANSYCSSGCCGIRGGGNRK